MGASVTREGLGRVGSSMEKSSVYIDKTIVCEWLGLSLGKGYSVIIDLQRQLKDSKVYLISSPTQSFIPEVLM